MRDGLASTPQAELLYGRNAVVECLEAGRKVYRLLVAEGVRTAGLTDLLEAAARHRVPVVTMDRRALDRMAGPHHQGVVCQAEPYTYRSLRDLLSLAETRREPPFLLLLDGLQDPQNFGALLRTALAVGAHGAIIPEHRAVAVTPGVLKASAGAAERLGIARLTNLTRTIEELKRSSVWVYGLAGDADQSFWELDWTGPVALAVGAEGAGLSRLVRQACDALVRIPMVPAGPESLNAAVAGSVVLCEILRQRQSLAKAQAALPP